WPVLADLLAQYFVRELPDENRGKKYSREERHGARDEDLHHGFSLCSFVRQKPFGDRPETIRVRRLHEHNILGFDMLIHKIHCRVDVLDAAGIHTVLPRRIGDGTLVDPGANDHGVVDAPGAEELT